MSGGAQPRTYCTFSLAQSGRELVHSTASAEKLLPAGFRPSPEVKLERKSPLSSTSSSKAAIPLEMTSQNEQLSTLTSTEKGLHAELSKLRQAFASELKLRPFDVFPWNTLMALTKLRPTKLELLSGVSGMSAERITRYGQRTLDVIGSFCTQNQLGVNLVPEKGAASTTGWIQVRGTKSSECDVSTDVLSDTERQAYDLYMNGQSVSDMAKSLDKAEGKVKELLTKCLLKGVKLPWSPSKLCLSPTDEPMIIAAIEIVMRSYVPGVTREISMRKREVREAMDCETDASIYPVRQK
jgi:hypothetical protein